MTRLLSIFIGMVFLTYLLSCSDSESSTPPQFRVHNIRLTKANLQIQTSGGNTININDVGHDSTTTYQSASQGLIEATATIQNETVSPTTSFNAANGGSYTIVVDTTTPPTLKVVSP
jgi:hypothetical protein